MSVNLGETHSASVPGKFDQLAQPNPKAPTSETNQLTIVNNMAFTRHGDGGFISADTSGMEVCRSWFVMRSRKSPDSD